MINREMQLVTVVSFTAGTDEYGQKRNNGQTTRQVEMMVKVYTQNRVNDIRYVDVTNIGLTKDNNITDENQIIIGEDTFEVMYVIPSTRYNQILLKKV